MKQIIAIVAIILTASSCTAQWKFDGNVQIYSFGVHDTSLFWCDDYTSGIYVHRYILSSSSIVPADSGIAGDMITSFASLGPYFFASANGGGATYVTSNNGSSWAGIHADGPIATNGTYLFGIDNITGVNPHIRRSRDSSKSWEEVTDFQPNVFGCNGSCIFAATNIFGATGDSLWRSLDSGSDTSWHPLSPPVSNIQNFAFVGSITVASNGSGTLIKSTDSGSNWTEITLPRRTITAIVSSGSYIFAGTDSGVFVSLDSGGSWHAENEGMSYLNVNTMCVFDTFLFVSSSSGQNWYIGQRPIREMVDTGKSGVVAILPVPDTFQIYPNPAMNSVTIMYPASARGMLSVVDITGRTWQNIPIQPGSSQIEFSVQSLPSGYYEIISNQSEHIWHTKLLIEH
jgi:Secretion system C-terminal sorting domain